MTTVNKYNYRKEAKSKNFEKFLGLEKPDLIAREQIVISNKINVVTEENIKDNINGKDVNHKFLVNKFQLKLFRDIVNNFEIKERPKYNFGSRLEKDNSSVVLSNIVEMISADKKVRNEE